MPDLDNPRPIGRIARWFDLRRDEIRPVCGAAIVLFLVNGSGVVLNNFAETAFLKRFGVHYLPIVLVVNAVLTFVVMGVVGGWMARMRPETLLRRILLGCGLLAGAVRLAIPFGAAGLYPIIYLMKTQFDLILTFLFWNLANERFSTRQAKHLFPLIMAAGILGGVAGSFGTPVLARVFGVDNILWVYVVFTALAAWRVGGPSTDVAPSPRVHGAGFSVAAEVKNAMPVLRTSTLARLLIVLTLLPNIVTPIIGYQFSFAVDMAYPNEATMLGFYSVFRGVQNLLGLGISLFAGRLYKRFGIPGSLLFHPANYLVVFIGFLFRFDLVTAVYAGLSVGVLRRAVQTPARAALLGLFPSQHRVALLPFLRGAVVRVGALIGSVFVLVCQSGYFMVCRMPLHPQNLSPFGALFAILWLVAAVKLFRRYPGILLEMLGGGPAGRSRVAVSFAPERVSDWRRRLSRAHHLVTRAGQLSALGSGDEDVERLRRHLCREARRQGWQILGELVEADATGALGRVRRGLEDDDPRTRANALEALEALVHQRLTTRLVPLLEEDAEAVELSPRVRGVGQAGARRALEKLAQGMDPVAADLARRLEERLTGGGSV